MNRRDFLKAIGLTAAVAVVPEIAVSFQQKAEIQIEPKLDFIDLEPLSVSSSQSYDTFHLESGFCTSVSTGDYRACIESVFEDKAYEKLFRKLEAGEKTNIRLNFEKEETFLISAYVSSVEFLTTGLKNDKLIVSIFDCEIIEA